MDHGGVANLCLALGIICFVAAIGGAWLWLRDFDPLNEDREEDSGDQQRDEVG